MDDVTDTAGIYLEVEVHGDAYAIDRACEGAIEVAYRAWQLESKDAILTLAHVCGDEWTIAASMISHYSLSTPAGRARVRDRTVEREQLLRAARRATGWSENDE